MSDEKQLNEMSVEELESYIGTLSQEEDQVIEVKDDTESESSTVIDTELADSDPVIAVPPKTETAASIDTDLLDLKLELNEAKKQIEELRKPKAQESDPFLDDLSNYDPQDVKVIQTLVQRQLEEERARSERERESERQSAIQSNEEFFAILTSVAGEKVAQIKGDIIKAMQEDQSGTYFKKDWLKNNWESFYKNKAKDNDRELLKSKKTMATTEIGRSHSSGSPIKKSIKDMTSDEYLAYTKSQGLDIFGGQ